MPADSPSGEAWPDLPGHCHTRTTENGVAHMGRAAPPLRRGGTTDRIRRQQIIAEITICCTGPGCRRSCGIVTEWNDGELRSTWWKSPPESSSAGRRDRESRVELILDRTAKGPDVDEQNAFDIGARSDGERRGGRAHPVLLKTERVAASRVRAGRRRRARRSCDDRRGAPGALRQKITSTPRAWRCCDRVREYGTHDPGTVAGSGGPDVSSAPACWGDIRRVPSRPGAGICLDERSG